MEEHVDDLAAKAGELGLRGVPVFVFQEGRDGVAERSLQGDRAVSKGAWFRFDRNSAATLARLLSAVAVFATGGLKALEARGRPEDRLMIASLRGDTEMSVVIDILAGLVVAALLLVAFLRSSPTAHCIGDPHARRRCCSALAGFAVVGSARPAPAASWSRSALAWFAAIACWRARSRSPRPATGRWCARRRSKWSSITRSAALEGLVLAGRNEGKMLGTMGEAELVALYRELGGDFESRQLLETYLDGRFPVWRQNAKANDGDGLGVAPGSGAMTKEEAYKVLGLEAGAAAADVRKAHRRLMQRLHPDLGGSSFLAARINEAKDVLLSDHH